VAKTVMRLVVEEYGNAGSRTHSYGAAAQREVTIARERVAGTLAAEPDEIIFTSGATESDNLAILGLAAFGAQVGKRHIVSTAIEHKAVLEPLGRLREDGFEVTLVPPDRAGYVAASHVLAAIRPDTLLVSIMHANNETGTIQPITEIAESLPFDEGPYFHVDAAQTYGRETPTLRHRRIDLVSVSGHKVFGPKGVGALLARRRNGQRAPLRPLMVGGGQERGLRPGTQPVPLIAGLGHAAELAEKEREVRTAACARIRSEALAALAPLDPVVHADPTRGVLPNILSIAVPGIDSEAVMVALKELVAISNGSACTSARYERSHVLSSMGLDEAEASGTVRLSWSHLTPPIPWPSIVATLDDLRI
jgi:cysteine desulfurase